MEKASIQLEQDPGATDDYFWRPAKTETMNKDSALSTKVGINCRIGHQMASKANLDRQSVLTTDTVYEIHPIWYAYNLRYAHKLRCAHTLIAVPTYSNRNTHIKK